MSKIFTSLFSLGRKDMSYCDQRNNVDFLKAANSLFVKLVRFVYNHTKYTQYNAVFQSTQFKSKSTRKITLTAFKSYVTYFPLSFVLFV